MEEMTGLSCDFTAVMTGMSRLLLSLFWDQFPQGTVFTDGDYPNRTWFISRSAYFPVNYAVFIGLRAYGVSGTLWCSSSPSELPPSAPSGHLRPLCYPPDSPDETGWIETDWALWTQACLDSPGHAGLSPEQSRFRWHKAD